MRVLKPGGWLLLPGSTMEPGADGDIARWQVHLSGGTLLPEDERARVVAEAGFMSPTRLNSPAGDSTHPGRPSPASAPGAGGDHRSSALTPGEPRPIHNSRT